MCNNFSKEFLKKKMCNNFYMEILKEKNLKKCNNLYKGFLVRKKFAAHFFFKEFLTNVVAHFFP